MFLHIGGSKIVFYKDIIGIFDLSLRQEKINKQFLEATPSTRFLNVRDFENSKSFIVTGEDAFLSPVSPLTLGRRNSAVEKGSHGKA